MDIEDVKKVEFDNLLRKERVRLDDIRGLAWTGIPKCFRGTVWKLLSGHIPLQKDDRTKSFQRKLISYKNLISSYYDPVKERFDPVKESKKLDSSSEDKTLRQILLDIPRTSPTIPLFHNEIVRSSLERILFLWAFKHPACGYVQGMNDILTPFYVVFLADKIAGGSLEEVFSFDVSGLNSNVLHEVEADCYFCFNSLLDYLQDNYTFSQPGVQLMTIKLESVVKRIDFDLFKHLQNEEIQFLQFAFRWMNCLLLRELKLESIVRLWDAYLAEKKQDFKDFHVFLCAALLTSFSPALKKLDFQGLMTFLQDLPTQDWSDQEIEELLGQAFVLKSLFSSSPQHLK